MLPEPGTDSSAFTTLRRGLKWSFHPNELFLERHRNEIGKRVRGGVIYDLYIDDAQTVPEAELRTEMHIPLE